MFIKCILLLTAIVCTNAEFSLSTPYVTGGSSVSSDEHLPFMVSLQSKGHHICGGTILKDDRILTAAHCVPAGPATGLNILAGTNDLTDPSGVLVQVLSCIHHENYVELKSNDIAICKLKDKLQIDQHKIGTIKMGTDYVEGGKFVKLAGWGLRIGFLPFTAPKKLRIATLKAFSAHKCKMFYSDVTDKEICADFFLNGACNGDSGGPLFVKTHEGYEQIALTSRGYKGCLPIIPEVYTRTSAYKDWIKTNVQL